MHPFRFGVQLSNASTGPAWRDTARTIEGLGYSTLFIPDHFDDQFGPLVALTVAAEATDHPPGGLAGVRQRLPPPGGPGQGDRHPRPAVRGPGGVRAGGGVDDHRLRAGGHDQRPGPGCGSTGWRRASRCSSPCGPTTPPPPSRARTTRSPGRWAPRPPSSAPTRRSSSGAAAGGCWASPPGRPTSWGSTPTWPPATSAPRSSPPPPPSSTTSGWPGSGRRPATGSTSSSCSA